MDVEFIGSRWHVGADITSSMLLTPSVGLERVVQQEPLPLSAAEAALIWQINNDFIVKRKEEKKKITPK